MGRDESNDAPRRAERSVTTVHRFPQQADAPLLRPGERVLLERWHRGCDDPRDRAALGRLIRSLH
ncbi:hypothetical protein [Roseovarius salis]|uniref:hypothetical protein n=1 Tax=Roseovarius salis TaxID=3376063 RepID=UPI0037C9C488